MMTVSFRIMVGIGISVRIKMGVRVRGAWLT